MYIRSADKQCSQEIALKKQRWEKGFTIIEVLIVLAIAGLILLIVFLAVPALQRNQRNIQRKHDAGLIAAAISEYRTLSSNKLPDELSTESASAAKLKLSNSASSSYAVADLAFYNGDQPPSTSPNAKAGSIAINPSGSVGSPTTPTVKAPGWSGLNYNNIDTYQVSIIVGENCNAAGTAAGSVSSKQVAIFYILETGSGNGMLQCLSV